MPQTLSRSCPIIVGRDHELAYSADLLTDAADGRGGVYLLSGEAGVGKSRLAQALIATAQWRGFRCLVGYCHSHDRAYPYAPFLDALRQARHTEGSETLARALSAQRDIFFRVLPELDTGDVTRATALPPEHEKRRLFEAFVTLCVRLATETPVLLTLEDLHWADETSLDLLRLLARRLTGTRVLIAATARTDEPSDDLRDWVEYVERNRLIHRITLDPLTEPDVRRMIAAMAVNPLPATARQTIQTHAEGNPFLVEELVHAFVEASSAGGPQALGWQSMAAGYVPAMIEETVARRLAILDENARRIAGAAAVIGHRFSYDLLRALTDLPDQALVVALKRLIAVNLVIEAPDDARAFSFRHALTREAIYHQMLGPERQQMHLRIAQTLAADPGTQRFVSASELGYHAFIAEEWELALDHCRRAGEQAHALYAPHAAVEHYSRALAAAHHLGVPRADILLMRGQSYEWTSDMDQARADYAVALQEARDSGDYRSEWQALIGLSAVWAGRDYERASHCYEDALALANAADDQSLRAQTLNRIGHLRSLTDRPSEALPYFQEALRIFQSLDDARGVAETLTKIGFAYCLSADLVQGAAYHRQAAERYRTLNDRGGIVECLVALTQGAPTLQSDWMVPATTSIRSAAADGEAALILARESSWRFGEALCQSFLAFCVGA
ncbi:MAG: ATP-binding protein, partial [Thermomicrobiales bacterium]